MARGRQEPGEPYRRISVQEALEMQKEGALIVDVVDVDEVLAVPRLFHGIDTLRL